jgi:hypothetical protein
MADETEKAHDILAAEEFVVPAPDPRLRTVAAHDVLAAEEFGVPAPDPVLAERVPHDVLAAEEFAMPAPDPVLRVVAGGVAPPLPSDPADPRGSAPAHDILAAEEFAMPGLPPLAMPPDFTPVETRSFGYGRLAYGGAAAAAVLFGVRLLRRRRLS